MLFLTPSSYSSLQVSVLGGFGSGTSGTTSGLLGSMPSTRQIWHTANVDGGKAVYTGDLVLISVGSAVGRGETLGDLVSVGTAVVEGLEEGAAVLNGKRTS